MDTTRHWQVTIDNKQLTDSLEALWTALEKDVETYHRVKTNKQGDKR